MFAMICTDNLRYKKTKYYDSEYVIKGTLHINEHAYAFSHYDGAFEVLGIRWLSNYTKGRYSKDTGLEFSFGADTEEGRLLQEHKDEAIECILQTVHAYKLTNIDAWVEYFNFAVSCTGTYQYSVTRCQAFPDERFRCTIKTPSPDCVLTYSFNFDEEEFPRLETPYFPGVELLETDIDKEFIISPGKWLYGILNITCGPDDENPLPLCNDHARIADLETALDCEVKRTLCERKVNPERSVAGLDARAGDSASRTEESAYFGIQLAVEQRYSRRKKNESLGANSGAFLERRSFQSWIFHIHSTKTGEGKSGHTNIAKRLCTRYNRRK